MVQRPQHGGLKVPDSIVLFLFLRVIMLVTRVRQNAQRIVRMACFVITVNIQDDWVNYLPSTSKMDVAKEAIWVFTEGRNVCIYELNPGHTTL